MSPNRQFNYSSSIDPKHKPRKIICPIIILRLRNQTRGIKNVLPKLSKLASNIPQKNSRTICRATKRADGIQQTTSEILNKFRGSKLDVIKNSRLV